MLEIILTTAAAVAFVAVVATFICIKANKKAKEAGKKAEEEKKAAEKEAEKKAKEAEKEFKNKLESRREQVLSSLVTPFEVANDYKVVPLTAEEKNPMLEYGVADVEVRVYNNEPVTLNKMENGKWYIKKGTECHHGIEYHDGMEVYTLPGYVVFLNVVFWNGDKGAVVVNSRTGQRLSYGEINPKQSGLMENGIVIMCSPSNYYNINFLIDRDGKEDYCGCHIENAVVEGVRMFTKDIVIVPIADGRLKLISLKKKRGTSLFVKWIKLKKNIYILVNKNGFSVFDAKQFKDKWFEGCTYKYNHKDGLEVINPDSMPLAYRKFCLKEWELDPAWKQYRNKFTKKDYAKSIIGV